MDMKYKWLSFVVIMISGCIQQPPGLEFSATSCDEKIDPYDPSNLGVKEVLWVDEVTLVVTVYVSVNCAEKIEGGDYEMVNGKIILKYTAPRCEVCTTCNCTRVLTYKFSNLPKKEYQFEIARVF